jgi:16S rRNA (cytidine1402-2'-O)-methyltransferase
MSDFPPAAPPARPVEPGLHVVSTPIGNLRDMTLRALDVLAAADLVLAEDTRVAAKLLKAYGLSRPVERYDDHVAEAAGPRILAALAGGARVALVSDAGTPLVSDPGYRLVREAASRGLAVHPLPGPSAPLAALVMSGLPTDRFLFAGFPPARRAARKTFLAELAAVRATLVFFETGPRLRESLEDMAEAFGERDAAVCREITKLYETCVRGSLGALAVDPKLAGPRGEIVVLVGAGSDAPATEADADAALGAALKRLGPADAAAEVARALGLPRKTLYRRALELQGRR